MREGPTAAMLLRRQIRVRAHRSTDLIKDRMLSKRPQGRANGRPSRPTYWRKRKLPRNSTDDETLAALINLPGHQFCKGLLRDSVACECALWRGNAREASRNPRGRAEPQACRRAKVDVARDFERAEAGAVSKSCVVYYIALDTGDATKFRSDYCSRCGRRRRRKPSYRHNSIVSVARMLRGSIST